MRHVGNRHHQPPAAPLLLAEHRVVEVARRLAVDGDQGQFAQVFAPLEVGLAHLVRHFLVFIERCPGKLEGQIMLAQRDLDFHAWIGIVAEHLDDLADRLRKLARLLDDLDHHHLPGLRLVLGLLLGRHQNILGNTLVLRHHEHHAMLDEDAADHLAVDPLGHLDDATFRAPLAVNAGDPNQRPVTVQHLAHLVLVEKDVGTAVVGNQKAVAIRMPLHPARRQAGPLGQDVGPLSVAHQLPFAFHRTQPALEHLSLAIGDVEQSSQFSEFKRPTFVGQYLRDVLAGGQRKIVAGRLTLEKGIRTADLG